MISLIYVTCPDLKEAQRIAEKMLKERLVGCANLLPGMQSLYHWKGKLESAAEVVLLLKTAPGKVPQALERIKELHPYDTPCALEVPVEKGLQKYQQWVIAETREEPSK